MIAAPHLSSTGHYCLFDTAFGACALAWNERGLMQVQLPEADRAATERSIRAHARGAQEAADLPPAISELIAMMQRYFAGEPVDFSGVAVDLTYAGGLRRKILDALRTVGWGRTVSYGELARIVGATDETGAREVGQTMGRNHTPVVIPCHRVLASGNKIGGFSAPGGIFTKEKLLWLEGVRVGDAAPLFAEFLPTQRRGERRR